MFMLREMGSTFHHKGKGCIRFYYMSKFISTRYFGRGFCSQKTCKLRTTKIMHGVQWGQVHVVNLDEYSKSFQGYQKIMIMESPSR
jgi:hypothetical protein